MLGKNITHRWKLFLNNIRLAFRYDILLEKGVTVKYIDSIRIGRKCTFQSGVYVYGSRSGKQVVFGDHVVIAQNGVILAEAGLEIGDGTHLGPNVVLTTQYGDRKHTESYATPSVKYAPVRIGKGVWVGSGSILMPGTVLGDYCTVAPNSVVYGKWDSGSMLSGNPAREGLMQDT